MGLYMNYQAAATILLLKIDPIVWKASVKFYSENKVEDTPL